MILKTKVALICNYLSPSLTDNLLRSAKWINEAGRRNVGLVCFGEYAFQGKEEDNYEKDFEMADTIRGHITDKLCDLSKRNSLSIVAGILERESKALYDSAVLVNQDDIILRYRRINPQWHGKDADKNLYRQGEEFRIAETMIGKIGIVICGDFFDDSVLAKVKKAKPDYLIVPTAIPIALFASSYGDNAIEKWATYKNECTDQAKNLGINCMIVNSISGKEKGNHSGGAVIISKTGDILAESEIEREAIVYHEW
jgi:predicted amidohydrolase